MCSIIQTMREKSGGSWEFLMEKAEFYYKYLLKCGGGARGLVRGLVLLSIEAKIRKYNISLKLWLEVESFINNKTDLCQKN